MGPPSYMRSFVDRNVVMLRITVYVWSTGWERTDKQHWQHSEKSLSHGHFVHHKSNMTNPDTEPVSTR